MVKPDREVLEAYRMKKLGWKKDAKLAKLKPIIVYGPEETIAYTHFFLPSRLVLIVLHYLYNSFKFLSINVNHFFKDIVEVHILVVRIEMDNIINIIVIIIVVIMIILILIFILPLILMHPRHFYLSCL